LSQPLIEGSAFGVPLNTNGVFALPIEVFRRYFEGFAVAHRYVVTKAFGHFGTAGCPKVTNAPAGYDIMPSARPRCD
jgi:hypothetical protein